MSGPVRDWGALLVPKTQCYLRQHSGILRNRKRRSGV